MEGRERASDGEAIPTRRGRRAAAAGPARRIVELLRP